MATIPQIADAMQTVLTTTADRLARTTQFVQRQPKLTGALFVQTMVFGVLRHPQPKLSDLTGTAADFGLQISPQGLENRFTEAAATLLRQVLEAAVGQVIAADPVAMPILQRFAAVVVQDSSIVTLPDELASVWQGSGNQTDRGRAAVKLSVQLNLHNGQLTGPVLADGRTHDQAVAMPGASLPPGSLRVTDLGYFNLDDFQCLDASGVFTLSRYKVGTMVLDLDGRPLDLLRVLADAGTSLDREVRLGSQHRLPFRLLAVSVPAAVADERRRKLRAEAKRKGQTVSQQRLRLAGWTILVTNAPADRLKLNEALVLLRARWQIELLFKLWKSHGRLGQSRSGNQWRILGEVYATLLALVVQHWILLVGCWAYPDRSLVKASQVVRDHVALLIAALRGLLPLTAALAVIQDCLAAGCRINSRRQHPNTYQLLLDPDEVLPDSEEVA